MAVGSHAQAADVASRLGLTALTDYQTNRLLRVPEVDDLNRLLLTPSLLTQVSDARYVFEVDAQLTSITSFEDSVENDRVDYLVGSSFQYAFETSVVETSFLYSRRSLLDTQIDDAGLFDNSGRQIEIGGDISWLKKLDNRSEVQVTAAINSVEITNIRDARFLNYSGSGAYTRGVSEQVTLGIAATASRQEIKSATNLQFGLTEGSATNTIGVTPTVEVRLNEYVTASARAGVVYVENELNDSLTWTVSAAIEYAVSRVTAQLSAERSFLPSANGTTRETSLVEASVDYDVTERVRASARASYRDSDIFGINAGNFEAVVASGDVTWTVAENVDVTARYLFQRQNNLFNTDTATNHAVSLQLTYQFDTGKIR